MRLFVVLCLLPVLVSGCAIHPETQDFSRDMMADIVFHAQCETQKAIISLEEEGVMHDAHRDMIASRRDRYKGAQGSPIESYRAFKNRLLKTGLTMTFRFVLTENNDLTSVGSVTWPVHLGTLKLGWDVGEKKQRETTQNITFKDSFKEILALDCRNAATRQNFKYPITGSIGLRDTFVNFVRIAARQPGEELTAFNDQIEFVTVVHGSVKPSINLKNSVGSVIQANVNALGKRSDLHRLKLTFRQKNTAYQNAILKSNREDLAQDKRDFIKWKKSLAQSVKIVDSSGLGTYGQKFTDADKAKGKKSNNPRTSQKVLPRRQPRTRPVTDDPKEGAWRDSLRDEYFENQQEILKRLDQ